jgi:hypothetical protein
MAVKFANAPLPPMLPSTQGPEVQEANWLAALQQARMHFHGAEAANKDAQLRHRAERREATRVPTLQQAQVYFRGAEVANKEAQLRQPAEREKETRAAELKVQSEREVEQVVNRLVNTQIAAVDPMMAMTQYSRAAARARFEAGGLQISDPRANAVVRRQKTALVAQEGGKLAQGISRAWGSQGASSHIDHPPPSHPATPTTKEERAARLAAMRTRRVANSVAAAALQQKAVLRAEKEARLSERKPRHN